MVQIIDEIESPSVGSRFAGAFANLGQQGARAFSDIAIERQKKKNMLKSQEEEDKRIFEETGLNLSGIKDQKLREKLVESGIKSKQAHQEKTAPYKAGLDTVKRMREIGKSGHLGPKIGQWGGLGFVSSDVRKDRSEYEQLGKSLISLASTIPIRNQMEFETLSNNLHDPTLTDAARDGILDAMERIIKQSLGEYDGGLSSGMEQEPSETKPMRRALSHFGH